MSKEREKQILEHLIRQKKVTVKEMAEKLFVSEPSIRRDFTTLENQHLIKRVHGGAVIEETALSRNKIPFVLREMEESNGKIIIAKKAAELVNDNDVIFLDASTSAYNIIPFLAFKHDITIVTNGVKALEKAAEFNINTLCTGGMLIPSCMALVGEEAYKTIETINADIVFFSCRGISQDGLLTDISKEENYVRIKMIENSAKAYMLCTHDKLKKKYYHNLCHKNKLTGIIKDDIENT